METVLLSLKLAGIVLSAVFGVLGTVHEFRDKSGRLTKWGAMSISGVVISALIAITAQLIEEHRERESERSAAQQTLASTKRLERIVADLGRSLQPLEAASVWLNVKLPMNDRSVETYKVRLDHGIAKYLAKKPEKHFFRVPGDKGISAPVLGLDRKPTHVAISAKSEMYPIFAREVCASSVFSIMHLYLSFFREPIDPSTFGATADSTQPDLKLVLQNFDRLDIQKDLAKSEYFLTGLFNDHIEGWERSNGRIVSVTDLSEAQMFLTFDRPLTESILDIKVCSTVAELRSRFEIDSFHLSFGKRERRIEPGDLKKHVSGDGFPFWEYRFPPSAF